MRLVDHLMARVVVHLGRKRNKYIKISKRNKNKISTKIGAISPNRHYLITEYHFYIEHKMHRHIRLTPNIQGDRSPVKAFRIESVAIIKLDD